MSGRVLHGAEKLKGRVCEANLPVRHHAVKREHSMKKRPRELTLKVDGLNAVGSGDEGVGILLKSCAWDFTSEYTGTQRTSIRRQNEKSVRNEKTQDSKLSGGKLGSPGFRFTITRLKGEKNSITRKT